MKRAVRSARVLCGALGAGLAAAGCSPAWTDDAAGRVLAPLLAQADAEPRLRPTPPAQPWLQEWIGGACEPSPLDLASARSGALDLFAAFELEAVAGGLGGLSGLDDAPEGLTAVSDEGHLVALDLGEDEAGRTTVRCRIVSLAAADGQLLTGKSQGDSEGLASLADGALLVSFERDHRISSFPGVPPRERETVRFGAHGLEGNQSLEALTVLADGRILVGAETPSVFGFAHPVWRLAPGEAVPPREPSFRIADRNGFGLVGFDVTPGGALLTLHRFYSARAGNRIRIGFIPRATAETASGIVDAREVAYLDGRGLPVDNFEGIATRSRADGVTEVWIVSDDNFSRNQRTLLYGFLFDEAAFAAAAGR